MPFTETDINYKLVFGEFNKLIRLIQRKNTLNVYKFTSLRFYVNVIEIQSIKKFSSESHSHTRICTHTRVSIVYELEGRANKRFEKKKNIPKNDFKPCGLNQFKLQVNFNRAIYWIN